MKIIRQIFILIALILLFTPSPLITNSHAADMQSWGYIPHYTTFTEIDISKALKKYDIISASGFYINSSGSIIRKKTAYVDRIFEECRRNGRIFYPMITFKTPQAGIKVLSSDKTRIRCAENIKALIGKYQYKGVHLDLEYIPPEHGPSLNLLLKETRMRTVKEKITFALYPQVDYNSPYRAFHDISKISPYIDEAVIMCYDLYNQTTSPGPVTELKWSEANVKYVLRFLEPSQVWLGIPSYGYIWNSGGTVRAVSAKYASKLTAKYHSDRSPSGTLYIRYNMNGLNEAYISDRYTREEMKKIAAKYRLTGWAVWRVGFED